MQSTAHAAHFSKRKTLLVAAFVIVTAAVLIGVSTLRNDPVSTFKSGEGWGYSITANGKVIIKQPYIPAIGNKVPFHSKKDAAKTGRMMLKKIQHGDSPTITIEELRKAGIIT
jgi:hypothetical protein